MGISIFLVLYLFLGSNRHITSCTSEQATKHLRCSCAFLRVAAFGNHGLYFVKQSFFNYCLVFALVHFATIAEMAVVKGVRQYALYLVFGQLFAAFGGNAFGLHKNGDTFNCLATLCV
ncbi:hypothetical protein KDA08_02640 [Candidatus Saccharibacteria bacterium]|nr:hypothetical protein [Candidatus Saccharibacteria bacterium]